MASRACPCCSSAPYDECCAPYHEGVREAPDATALMRSRFAAFGLKNAEYLWRTLHRDHDDRTRPQALVLKEIRDACVANRYLALRVLDARDADASGVAKVLFAAKVFFRGRDLSFVECSDFVHDGVGWRYLTGEGVSCPFDAVDPSMTIASFLGRA
jgi:SEC-C motif-containing protein